MRPTMSLTSASLGHRCPRSARLVALVRGNRGRPRFSSSASSVRSPRLRASRARARSEPRQGPRARARSRLTARSRTSSQTPIVATAWPSSCWPADSVALARPLEQRAEARALRERQTRAAASPSPPEDRRAAPCRSRSNRPRSRACRRRAGTPRPSARRKCRALRRSDRSGPGDDGAGARRPTEERRRLVLEDAESRPSSVVSSVARPRSWTISPSTSLRNVVSSSARRAGAAASVRSSAWVRSRSPARTLTALPQTVRAAGLTAPLGAVVDDVVVQERRRVNQLRDHRELARGVGKRTEARGREEHGERPDALCLPPRPGGRRRAVPGGRPRTPPLRARPRCRRARARRRSLDRREARFERPTPGAPTMSAVSFSNRSGCCGS